MAVRIDAMCFCSCYTNCNSFHNNNLASCELAAQYRTAKSASESGPALCRIYYKTTYSLQYSYRRGYAILGKRQSLEHCKTYKLIFKYLGGANCPVTKRPYTMTSIQVFLSIQFCTGFNTMV